MKKLQRTKRESIAAITMCGVFNIIVVIFMNERFVVVVISTKI